MGTTHNMKTGMESDQLRWLCNQFIAADEKLSEARELAGKNPVKAFGLAREANQAYYDVTHAHGFDAGITTTIYPVMIQYSWPELNKATNQVMNESFRNMGETGPETLRKEFNLGITQGIGNKIKTAFTKGPPTYNFCEMHV